MKCAHLQFDAEGVPIARALAAVSGRGAVDEPGDIWLCGDNRTGVAPPPAADWVTVEAEVHVMGDTKVFQRASRSSTKTSS